MATVYLDFFYFIENSLSWWKNFTVCNVFIKFLKKVK